MRLLFIGDIVGRPGRAIVKEKLMELRGEMKLDFVVANAENAAGGSGLTAALAKELHEAGIDGITLGDHTWDQQGFYSAIDGLEKVCRPANFPFQNPGKSWILLEKEGFRLGVFTVLGRNFMKVKASCPFETASRIIQEQSGAVDAFFVEVHAEATSEKVALGRFLDGRVSCVAGTHTHIPTADASLLPRGSAYITDVGMTGPYESVLGRDIQAVVESFIDGIPRRFSVAEKDVRLCGCVVDINEKTGLADRIQRFEIRYEAQIEE